MAIPDALHGMISGQLRQRLPGLSADAPIGGCVPSARGFASPSSGADGRRTRGPFTCGFSMTAQTPALGRSPSDARKLNWGSARLQLTFDLLANALRPCRRGSGLTPAATRA